MSRLLAISISIASTTTFANPSSRDNYVEGKLVLGDEDLPGIAGMLVTATGLEAGRRVTEHVWVHGALEAGSAASFDRYHGAYLVVQAGVGGRVCTSTDVLCGALGIDAAALHITQVYDPMHTGVDYTAPGGFARAGVDAGGARVRAQLGFETGHAWGHAGYVANLSLGVSVEW